MFKQILMVGGVDRYYQLARCFRDEDLRADRQPEHTQIDVEMSFMAAAEIRELLEGLMAAIFEGVGEGPLELPLPTLTYDEAMLRYGSDKPDLRYGLEIVELSDLFAEQRASRCSATRSRAAAWCAPSGRPAAAACRAPRSTASPSVAKAHGARGMAYVFVEDGRALRGPIVKFLSGRRTDAPWSSAPAPSPATSSSSPPTRPRPRRPCWAPCARALIGLLAPEPSRRWSLLWVIEFPLFEIDAETGALTYGHNPFSLPTDDTLAYLDSEPLRVRGAQYDLVLNGVELGSGSLRIPDAALQRSDPAHAGPERGAHRRVVRLVPRGARATARRRTAASAWGSTASSCCWPARSSIRDVIAFPKTASGSDPMTGAPGARRPVRDLQLRRSLARRAVAASSTARAAAQLIAQAFRRVPT